MKYFESAVNNSNKLVSQRFFSIVITTYNRAQLLIRAINSLICQTEEDWEAIIVDDGSMDDTFVQILPFLNEYSKIRYLRKAHSGGVQSKNAGIFSSYGKFISFLDSDDEYNPDHLKSRKRILLKNTSVKFLHGGVKILGNQYVPNRFDYSKKIHLRDCVVGGTFVVESHALRLLNGFREIPLGTDADLFERALKAKVEMMETTIPTYIYHHETQNSITNSLLLNVELPQ